MDLFTVTVAVMGVCNRIMTYASRIKSAEDDLLLQLKNQTRLLSDVLSALNDPSHVEIVQQRIKSANDDGDGFESQYWNSLKESLTRCQDTLHKLEEYLKNESKGIVERILRCRLLAPVRLQSQREEITDYIHEIKFYREAISIAIQFIALYSVF